MTIDEDKIPFTCRVTNEYCGGQIDALTLHSDAKTYLSIPISEDSLKKLKSSTIRKIEKFIISELKK